MTRPLSVETRRPLDEDYTAYCKLCKRNRVNKKNTTLICPDCWAELSENEKKAQMNLMEQEGKVLPTLKEFLGMSPEHNPIEPGKPTMKQEEKPTMTYCPKCKHTVAMSVDGKCPECKSLRKLFIVWKSGSKNVFDIPERVIGVYINKSGALLNWRYDTQPHDANRWQGYLYVEFTLEAQQYIYLNKLLPKTELETLREQWREYYHANPERAEVVMLPEELNGEQVVLMADGKIASTKTHDYHLIPRIALERLAARFALGQKKKGDKSWNALSNNQEVLLDKDWMIERLSHVIDHALILRDKIASNDIEAILSDDDAGAIAWAGCFLICATDAMINSIPQEAEPPKYPS
jgi:Zn finger protein HypA/HybF involved in hydrogenase expression